MVSRKVTVFTQAGRRDLDFYNREIARYQLLTVEEERALIKRFQTTRDRSAMNQLVGANLRFLIHIVGSYTVTGMRLEDLMQEGVIGFMKAIEKFDETRNIRLLTYAAWWVRAYIQLYVIRNWSVVELSNRHRRVFFSIAKLVSNWRSNNGDREPTAEELAPMLNTTVDEVHIILQRMSRDSSLQMPRFDDRENDGTMQDDVCCTRPTQDVLLEDEQEKRYARVRIRRALWHLNKREQFIIRKRFLEGGVNTFAMIGRELGVSREYVRQVQMRAIKKIAKQLGSDQTPESIYTALREYFPIAYESSNAGT